MTKRGGEIVARVVNAPTEDAGETAAPPPVAQDDPPPARRRRPQKSAGDSPAPQDGGGGGFDSADEAIESLNGEWAFVLMGSKAVVIRETPSAPVRDRTRVLSLDAFKAYLQNRTIRRVRRERDELSGEMVDKVSHHKVAPLWLASRARRTYEGIEFFPDPSNIPNAPGYFNLWRGFDVAPAFDVPAKERVKRYATFYDHLRVNICRGDETLFAWLFGWLAHMTQRPRERIGTAVVLRGGEGWGKTKIGEVMGSLFASHYFLVDDPRYLVGQFNAHMASCILLQVDEGFWAGDKAAEGRLKGLITARTQMIEAKGVDPIPLDNYVRLLFSSNEDWVVPVGLDGRRYCVIDISPAQARNAEYFGAMDAEMAAGGRAALLADLLTFDLARINLRDTPKTGALLEQKLRSLDSVTAWWFERLMDGSVTRRRHGWAAAKGAAGVIAVDTLFDDYVHVAEKVGVRRKSEKTAFGMRMKKLLTVEGLCVLKQVKRSVDIELGDGTTAIRRMPCYELPDLATCRAAFEVAAQQKVEWLLDDEPGDGARAGGSA